LAKAEIITDTQSEIEAGVGATTKPTSTTQTTGINFDPSQNTIGDPKGSTKVVSATGSVKRLTFLAGGNNPAAIMVNIINVSLSVLGLASLMMMAYAGFLWFTAQDNEEQISKSKQVIIGSIIGLILTLLSLGLGQLLFNQLNAITTAPAAAPMPPAAPATVASPNYKPETLPFDPTAATNRNVATLLGLGTNNPFAVAYGIINIVLTFLAFGFLLLLIYAGTLWVIARGKEETITRAKQLIKRAIIGLIIILSSFGISYVVFILISDATYNGEHETNTIDFTE